MKRKTSLWQYILDKAGLEEEPTPTQPVVELLGEGRVLIEHHRGVNQYSTERVQVRVCYGEVRVLGRNLRLRLMTGHKLVILGKIDGIEVWRGRGT